MLLTRKKLLLIVLGDAACLNLSFFWVTLLRRWGEVSTPYIIRHGILFAILTILWIWIFHLCGLYEPRNIQSKREGVLATAILAAFFISSLGIYFIHGIFEIPAPKVILLLSGAMAWAMIEYWRSLLGQRILESPETIASAQSLQKILVLDRKLLDDATANGYHEILKTAALKGLPVFTNSSYQALKSGKIPLEEISSAWLIENILTPAQSRLFYQVLKRCGDILLSLMIAAPAIPALSLAACWIKLFLGSPVLYRQQRVGKGGQSFWIWKLRTMKESPATPMEQQITLPNDPRIPRSIHWIRKTQLAALPQIFNILKSEMSLVGPRPEQLPIAQRLDQSLPYFWARHTAPPGLTGWAQINMGYAETPADAKARFEYDLYYLAHQTPWLDLSILIRTLRNVLAADGR